MAATSWVASPGGSEGRLGPATGAGPALGRVSLGGQAVNEGVMIRGDRWWAVAVRGPDEAVVVARREVPGRSGARRLPFVRGVLALADSFTIGLAAIRLSTMLGRPGGSVPGRASMRLVLAGAVALNVALFVVLPGLATQHLLGGVSGQRVLFGLVDGGIRVGVFVAWLGGVRMTGLGRRLFGWHGAEHQVIAAYEAGEPPASSEFLARTAACSPRHPRCGTNFLFMLFVLVSLGDALVGGGGALVALERLALLPVMASAGYELLKLAGQRARGAGNGEVLAPRGPGARLLGRGWGLLAAPGLAAQYLTTAPPRPDQLEVARIALLAALGQEIPGLVA
jgi:uncharacterized protein YqhQ